MGNNERSVYERLDSIEAILSATQTQNEEIKGRLDSLNNKQPEKNNIEHKPQPQLSNNAVLRKFALNSIKEYVWFGTIDEFNKSKIILNTLCVFLIIVGVVSTILTSIALKVYSTFSLFENIWFVFACIMFSQSLNAKKRMRDTDLKKHCNTIFVQNEEGTWIDTNKEKKRFRWIRRISYIAVACNIIATWIFSKGVIAISATIFEVAFAALTIGMLYAHVNLFCMYGDFILFTGRNESNTETVTLVLDRIHKQLAVYDEYKENLQGNI